MLRLFNRRPDYRQAAVGLANYNLDAATIEKFAAFLEGANDRELFYINPRYLAERLTISERAALRLLLGSLYEGIVLLHWEVRCPACGSIGHRNDSLGNLHHNDECSVCRFQFAPRLDDEVRIRFSVHPRLRTLPANADDVTFRSEIDTRLGPVPGQSLMVLPEFQRLFPQQRLLPDESLDVARAALLFTDLAGSTALYAQRGDPRAYYLVRLHFDELFRVADEHSGTIVKTIGDAVLGVFQSPAEALSAAFSMQEAIRALNARARLSQPEELILKVGLHSGPCLSVTLNERPDYFGTTVNIAARVQGLSHGRDIVFTEAIRTDHEAAQLLTGYELESGHVKLRGIDEDVLVHRLATGA